MSKRAIILAGGKGTRLKPYTVSLPKPLMPIGDWPILEIIIRQLSKYGFDHVTMAVNHQADIIKAFFGDGSKWGLNIDYSLELKPLSTMGPLRLINDLPEDFLVMNGDILTNLDFNDLFETHIRNQNIFTISSYQREVKSEFGVLEVGNGVLMGFQEKPVSVFDVSMGIYMVSRKVLEYIPENSFYGFDNLMVDLIGDQNNAKIYPFNGYWLDIGRPDDYLQAIEEFDKMKDQFI
ncbi:MAG: sugar phosphate nucleotidyltransferase [Pseudomonadota bacterium]